MLDKKQASQDLDLSYNQVHISIVQSSLPGLRRHYINNVLHMGREVFQYRKNNERFSYHNVLLKCRELHFILLRKTLHLLNKKTENRKKKEK